MLAFERGDGPDRLLVALNFGTDPVSMPVAAGLDTRIVISTGPDRPDGIVDGSVRLGGLEGVIVRIGRAS